MRRALVCMVALSALAVLAVPAGAARRRHKHLPPLCSPGSSPFKSAALPYRRTIAVDPYAQVYSLSSRAPVPPLNTYGGDGSDWRIYGCVYGYRGAYLLGFLPNFTTTSRYSTGYFEGDLNVVLAGPIVAYESFVLAEGLNAYRWRVDVKDLRTGRTLRKEPTGLPANLGGEPEFEVIAGIGHTTAIVVKSDGSVAWIVNPNEASGHYQVHAADTTGSRVLASGADIDPTSLALAGSTIYWMQGGQPHAAPLN
jgi:hypothetical protein